MIFIKVFQKLSQFSGKVPLEHWVSRIAVNTCLNQIQWEKIRPELRHADLSVEEIRKITGWSAALVKIRAFRARQKMKQQLAKISEKEKR